MLREISHVSQTPGEPKKSWYTDDFFDLFVWFDEQDKIVSFQLSYGKPANEKMLTWNKRSGITHARVDDGEQQAGRQKAAPILVRDGPVANALTDDFRSACTQIDQRVATFVIEKLEQFFIETTRPTLPTLPAFRAVSSPEK